MREHVADRLQGGVALVVGRAENAGLRCRDARDRAGVGFERDGCQRRVDERAEARTGGPRLGAVDLDRLDRRDDDVFVLESLFALPVARPGCRGGDAQRRTRRAGQPGGEMGLPPLVLGEALLDREHVAVLHDQIVAREAERGFRAEREVARIPPDDCIRAGARGLGLGARELVQAGSDGRRPRGIAVGAHEHGVLRAERGTSRRAVGARAATRRADRSPASADRASRRRTARRRRPARRGRRARASRRRRSAARLPLVRAPLPPRRAAADRWAPSRRSSARRAAVRDRASAPPRRATACT